MQWRNRRKKSRWSRIPEAKWQRGRKRSALVPVVIAGCIGSTLVVGWFLFFSHIFTIDLIDISVQGDMDSAEMRQVFFKEMEGKRFIVFPRSNIFIFDSRTTTRMLQQLFSLSEIHIRKSFPNRLAVRAAGKRFRALWYTNSILYELAPSGQIVRSIDASAVNLPPELQKYSSSTSLAVLQGKKKGGDPLNVTPIILDEKNQPAAIGQTVLSDDEISALTSLPAELGAVGIQLSSLSLSQGAPDFLVTTTEGWRIRLTFHESLEEQIHYLDTLLRESIKKKRKKLELIDARFENKLFYSLKNNE